TRRSTSLTATPPPPTPPLLPYTTVFRSDVEPSLRQRARRLSQERFRALVPGDRVEPDEARHERQQAAARLLDQPLLFARERVLRSEEHTSELQSPDQLVSRLPLEKQKVH